jgi:hypothetical protein
MTCVSADGTGEAGATGVCAGSFGAPHEASADFSWSRRSAQRFERPTILLITDGFHEVRAESASCPQIPILVAVGRTFLHRLTPPSSGFFTAPPLQDFAGQRVPVMGRQSERAGEGSPVGAPDDDGLLPQCAWPHPPGTSSHLRGQPQPECFGRRRLQSRPTGGYFDLHLLQQVWVQAGGELSKRRSTRVRGSRLG